MNIAALKAARGKALDDAQALATLAETQNREMTADEVKSFDGFMASAKQHKASIDRLEALGVERADLAKTVRLVKPVDPIVNPTASEPKEFKLPATARRTGTLKNLKTDAEAYRFGMWCLAANGRPSAQQFCSDFGLALHSEGTNTAGAYLVPDEFDNTLIDLREVYGVFRKYAKIVPMTSDTKSMPRRTGGLTAYFTGEGAAGTESSKTWDRVSLTAKKLMVLSRYTSELNEDAVINIGDDLAGEIAYAFANKEDDCGFNGDGTSTYGGIVGVRNRLLNLSATRANISGLFVGAGNAWSELLLTDFEAVAGKLPQYADNSNTRWFMHKTFWETVAKKLALAAGGVTAAEIIAGVRTLTFLGYPVVISQILPKAEANDQVCCLLGDLSMAAMLGDRRGTEIAFSQEASVGGQSMWERDELGIKGTERFDINVHDVGDANATASAQNPGPIVGLLTAAS